jgi:hypothetical protein
MSKNVPQEIQEKVVSYYVEEPDKYKSAKDLLPVLERFGYKIGIRNIQLWKSFKDAQEERRNLELDRAKDKVAQSLEEQVDDLTKSLSFYTNQSNLVKDKIMKSDPGTKEYSNCIMDLEKIDKMYNSLHEKYITILKLLNINNPIIRSDDVKIDSFDDIMKLLKGSK